MKIIKLACVLGTVAALSACGASEIVTRDAPFEVQSTAPLTPIPSFRPIETNVPSITRTISKRAHAPRTILPEVILRQINVAQINVIVPQKLRVSEANRYYPTADIVWRGEPIGNRHAQISRLVHDAIAAGTAGFNGPADVILDVEVRRFHSVTEKARYTVGGIHNVVFQMMLRDAKTGAPLSRSYRISTSLEAFGGQQAIEAEKRGLTQKKRITTHLAEVVRQELTKERLYENAAAGFLTQPSRI